MVKVEAGATGKTLVLSAFALTLLYALFLDPVILLAAIASASIAAYALCLAVLKAKRLRGNLKVKPGEASLRLVAGTRKTVKVKVEAPKRAKFFVRHPLKFCRVKPELYRANEELTLEVSPSVSGVYASEWLELRVYSPLKAFAAEFQVPFRTSVTVIPRVIPAVIRALEVASSLGVAAYEVPLQAIGRGTEYAETREYIPGDDLRRMDWKATARLQKLMVKQYHQEAGGRVNLVYDLKAAGPASKDKAATEFLNTAVTLTTQNLPYTITIVDEKGQMQTLRFKDGLTALLTAIKYALKAVEVDYTYLYELMDPQAAREALILLKMVEGGQAPIEERGKKPPEEPFNAIAVTCLLGDLTWLIDLHEEAKKLGGRLTVYTPPQVWLDSPTLEQAYMDFERQIRIMASLKRKGIELKTGETALEKEKLVNVNNR
ncbi:MAG: DUF58 domain-containing protein [Candidatus Nezhaarchaeales archaeon]